MKKRCLENRRGEWENNFPQGSYSFSLGFHLFLLLNAAGTSSLGLNLTKTNHVFIKKVRLHNSQVVISIYNKNSWDKLRSKPVPYGLQTIPSGGCGSGWGQGGGGGCTVSRVCSVAAVACSCDTVQMCGKTQAPAVLTGSWKANASSEVRPAFEVFSAPAWTSQERVAMQRWQTSSQPFSPPPLQSLGDRLDTQWAHWTSKKTNRTANRDGGWSKMLWLMD